MSKRPSVQYHDYMVKLYKKEMQGRDTEEVRKNAVKTLTFQVTENCNLACKYCYQTNKTCKRMSFDIAKKAIDNLLTGENGFDKYINSEKTEAIILEFIGGEPFLEIELIDKIVDYFREQSLKMNHKWANRFRISICSNGVLYRDPRVQKFLQKNYNVLSFSVTVDGTKELHDACRVFPDGSPSYDLAYDAAMDWMKRGYYMGSKITIAPENITYLSESILKMINDGYYDINVNCVYEKGWTIEHAQELYKQCKTFTNEFQKKYNNVDFEISLLREEIGMPEPESKNHNWCGGTGSMLAMNADGNLYPCIRYMESSLGNARKPMIIGNIYDGLMATPCQNQCVECLNKITRRSQSTDQCFYCPISENCSWCSAYNYQEHGTADKRATYICEMHKARVLASVYYWNTYYKKINGGRVMNLFVPRQWAVPIIGEEEYDMLVSLTKELGGYVNEDATMIRCIDDNGIKNVYYYIDNNKYEILQK